MRHDPYIALGHAAFDALCIVHVQVLSRDRPVMRTNQPPAPTLTPLPPPTPILPPPTPAADSGGFDPAAVAGVKVAAAVVILLAVGTIGFCAVRNRQGKRELLVRPQL